MRLLLIVSLAAFGVVASTNADDSALVKGRALSEAFLGRDMSQIWPAMTPELRAALGDPATLRNLRNQLEQTHGAEADAPQEDVQDQGEIQTYRRTAQWTKSGTQLVMQWSFDPQGKIAGFFVRPAQTVAESRFLDYQTKAVLRVPFRGEWFVFWGGRTLEQNYHAADKAQRFALDLLIRKNGASYAGDAAKLDSYHCWDQPILAPAEGVVAGAVDGLRDQPIGEGNPKNPAGNHVILDLGKGEFAFLAHLRKGSVTIEPGDQVTTGQELGKCGNSGNSSEPHLHFHLQTTPDLRAGEGLPAFFENYRADGKMVGRGEPIQGQVVAPASPN
ncbi:M23 family metallopeptidase [Dongia deserti]|uniref:M23 family metallopeptidase n=1 Tax=Dongia deserti TaxID=2268030 RepID=UPI000E64C1D9|nr:M23 family metallopeptidase [Dongia deserti]